jgi:hypothetical protein
MHYSTIIFWLCVAVLLGVIVYPFVQFFRKKERTWKDISMLIGGVAGLTFLIGSFWGAIGVGKQPFFLGMMLECFFGLDDPSLEC